jgi:cell volume regulation protein A
MEEPFRILLTTSVLVLLSILASKVSDRFGVPVAVVFLALGMLAGSDGLGGIYFDNAVAANFVGTLALAFILFSGGLDTNWRVVRPVLGRGLALSTVGVAITALLVGLFTWRVLGFSFGEGLLLGSIVSSTDAAAVFGVLRSRGVGLRGELKPLLEFESGSNDPMAVFMTLGVLGFLQHGGFSWTSLAGAFVLNMAGGVLMGIALGFAAGWVFNRIRLDYEGLYPTLSIGVVLFVYGVSEYVHANGFLAVYACGMTLGNTDFPNKRYVLKFHDGLAWLMQIGMFLVLGLLVFPSRFPQVVVPALLVAGFLMFAARPLAVFTALLGSRFSLAERALVAWTGLRGAVPIVLATFPLMAGYAGSSSIFHMVFFTVLASVLLQGKTLMSAASLLGVDEPMSARPKNPLEFERTPQMQGDVREFEILPNMAAAGKSIAELELPRDVLILLIRRNEGFVVPRGHTRIAPYDTLMVMAEPGGLRVAREILSAPSVREALSGHPKEEPAEKTKKEAEETLRIP